MNARWTADYFVSGCFGTFRCSQADAAMSAVEGKADEGRALFDFRS
jgi:hypothetical protein